MSIQPHMSNSSKDECSTGDFFFFYVFAVCLSVTLTVWLTGSQKISMSDGVTIIFFVQFIALCVRENVFLYMRWLYLRMYACMCVYVFMYVCIYLCMCIYVCTYLHICTYRFRFRVRVLCVSVCTYVCVMMSLDVNRIWWHL